MKSIGKHKIPNWLNINQQKKVQAIIFLLQCADEVVPTHV